MKRYLIKFIEPDGKSHLEENINFETKERAKSYIDYYNSQIMCDMRFDVVYMDVEKEKVEKSVFYNKCVDDFIKEIKGVQ